MKNSTAAQGLVALCARDFYSMEKEASRACEQTGGPLRSVTICDPFPITRAVAMPLTMSGWSFSAGTDSLTLPIWKKYSGNKEKLFFIVDEKFLNGFKIEHSFFVKVRGDLSAEEFLEVELDKEGPQLIGKGFFFKKFVVYRPESNSIEVLSPTIDVQYVHPIRVQKYVEVLQSIFMRAVEKGIATKIFSTEDGFKCFTFIKKPSGTLCLHQKDVFLSSNILCLLLSENVLESFLEEVDLQGKDHSELVLTEGKVPVYITCKKNMNGSFSVQGSFPILLYPALSVLPEKWGIFNAIYEKLTSGVRGEGKKKKPALLLLLEKAQNEGSSSVLVGEGRKLYQVVVTKNSKGFFIIDYMNPTLSREELKFAGLSDKSISLFLQRESTFLKAVFLFALIRSPGKMTAELKLSQTEVVQLHIKPDGVVSIGIGESFAEGGMKIVQKMVKIGIHKKIYVVATLKVSAKVDAFREEISSMRKFAEPHILKLRKSFEQVVPVLDAQTYVVSLEKRIGMKTEFCDKGDFFSLISEPPVTFQQCLERLEIVRDAALGLAYIHSYREDQDEKTKQPQKYAYMDFKPENLLVKTAQGKLLGIIGDVNPVVEGRASRRTPPFADSIANQDLKSHQASDVWALGLTLFEAMYGPQESLFEKIIFNEGGGLSRGSAETLKQAHMEILEKLHTAPVDDLIRCMLVLDRSKRATLTPEFLKKFDDAIVALREKEKLS